MTDDAKPGTEENDDDKRELTDDELDDVAGGSEMGTFKYGT
jgi:hypothetical protein